MNSARGPRKAFRATSRVAKSARPVPGPPVGRSNTDEAMLSLEGLRKEVAGCKRCPLYAGATQAVAGEGPPRAQLMFVGEQPGDQEDLQGRPFVGPAGRLLDRAMAEAGLDRSSAYVTNAVKHFKSEPRGKRRIHKKPNAGEVTACRWWLEKEITAVQPGLIVALGATAAVTLARRPISVTRERGPVMFGALQGFVTTHPSALLRAPDDSRKQEYDRFVADLREIRKMCAL